MKDRQKSAGKTKLKNMLKSGKELKIFSVRQEDLKKFVEEAKRYGILYSLLINKKNKSNDGIVDIMVRAEDASKINRIVDRFKMSRYDDVSIRSDVEKTKNKEGKEKGVKTKTSNDIIKEQEGKEVIKKEEHSLNPHLAKTEKSPLSKPSLKMQKTSAQGIKTMIVKKKSVKEKLDKAKIDAKKIDMSKNKSEVNKSTPNKSKKKKEKTK